MDVEGSAAKILENSYFSKVQEQSYLFEKLQEVFEVTVEHVADVFTYSKFLVHYGKEPNADTKYLVENMIHQLRCTIRQELKDAFFELCVKYRIKEHLYALTVELEKEKILKEFENLSGFIFSQGEEHYFKFLAGVVSTLKQLNKEVSGGEKVVKAF